MRDQYPYRRSRFPYFILGATVTIILLCLLVIFVYNLPPVHSRLAWRLENLWYKINPPKVEAFVPKGQGTIATLARATALAFNPTSTPTSTPFPSPTPTPTSPEDTPRPSSTSTITLSPTPTNTPLPPMVSLKGVRYEDQKGRQNYCAPANLAMALSYWGWQGNRDTVGPAIKPDSNDKNVMPYEMVDYILGYTSLKAVVRVGGDSSLIKRFIASGFPVLVEKGIFHIDLNNMTSWMGHYQVLTGYDDSQGILIAQDSLIKPDFTEAYDDFLIEWRSFNYTYILIYSPDREADVMALLGPDADETSNYQRAAQKASEEIYTLTGVDQAFAWFDYGSSLVHLQDYVGAAAAYDQAFSEFATFPPEDRLDRMIWYQTGPYFAYYYTGRYTDVIDLADKTFDIMDKMGKGSPVPVQKNLEESYLWRGRAKVQIGDTDGAIKDFEECLKWHPGWELAVEQLKELGVEP